MGGGPTDVILVIVEWPEPLALTERLRKAYPHTRVTWQQHSTRDPLPEDIWKDVSILVTMFNLPPSLALAPRLSYVHFFSAGVNHVWKHPIYTDTKIPLTTSSGVHGPQIAEWVVMTALVLNHGYNHWRKLQLERRWGDFRGVKVRDWAGQKVGILGYGGIGRQVGRALAGLGMDVYAYTASPRETPESRRDTGYIVPGTGDPDGTIPKQWFSGLAKPDLHAFLQLELDIIVLSLPLTSSTHHLLGAEEFALLGRQKHPPLISNISRGQIVDQEAMIASLEKGELRGACLDVTDPEPLPKESKLWGMENVIITPHVSGTAEKYIGRTWEILEMNLARRRKGQHLINEVDREKGY